MDFELLGSAEKMVASNLADAIKTTREAVLKLAEELEEVDVDQIEAALLDTSRREAVIQTAGIFAKIPARIADVQLVTILTKAFLRTPDEVRS